MRVHWSVSLLLLLSCGVPEHADRSAVFRYNERQGITDLDPAFARNLEHMWVVDQLFDGLVEMDPRMQVRPSVAHSWEVLDSGRTYRFHLDPTVRFHDDVAFPDSVGRRVTAADFVYSFERIRDARTASPGRWVFDLVLPGEAGIRAIGADTLELRLERAFPPFLGMLAMAYCNVVPREAVEHHGPEWRKHPVGCGPFRFFQWREGVKLVLQRYPRYHRKDEEGNALPYLDAVVVSFVKDPNAEFLALVKGELDMVSGAEGGFLNELLDPLGEMAPKYADRIHMERAPGLATDYLGFLMDSSAASVVGTPWADRRVRRALSLATDRQRLVTYLKHGIGRPAQSIIPPVLPGTQAPFWSSGPYRPEEARRLLAEAGHPDGRGLPPITLTTTSSHLDICEFLQHEWRGFGIDLRVDVVPLSTHKEGVANGDHMFFRKNWIADYPDAENFLLLFASGNSAPAGPNYTRTHLPAYDRLYAEALRTTDDSIRLARYAGMEALLLEECPAIFLLHPEVVRFIRNEVSGLGADPMNQLDLRRVKRTGRSLSAGAGSGR